MSDVDGSPVNGSAVFGAVADIYHDSRPPLPPQTLAWLTEGEYRDVLDLAAGTGRLTEQLITRRPWIPRVHAVEPDARMLEVLCQRCPGALAQQGWAEAIPLGEHSMDAVFVADAWQWFDHPTTFAEIARVLRPGGRLGVVWNHRDTTAPWVAGLGDVLPHHQWRADPPGVFTVPPDSVFAAPEQHEQASTWSVTVPQLMTSLRTYSSLFTLPDDQAQHQLVAAQRYVEEVLGDPSIVDVPIRTVAYRTQVAGG
jgi:SAM-dependent methyltransferase